MVPADLKDGRIVIVGASLAGLRAAEALREEGFTGPLTVVGDEPHPPYDRPPLSKQVLLGQATADSTGLPMREDPDADWRLGMRATGVDLAGTPIAQGTPVVLVLTSGNRDPRRFHDPDRFDPTRPDNQHLGFGSGIHLCYGGPLARVEAYAALGALLPHLGGARLIEDPPPYRQNAMLRGPRHLPIHL